MDANLVADWRLTKYQIKLFTIIQLLNLIPCCRISTWSYENRVSKHFVIFPNFPGLIACLLSCLLMCFFVCFFFFACFVVRDLCRSGWRKNYYVNSPPPASPSYFFPYPQFFLSHKWQLFKNSARLKLVSARFIRLLLDVGHLAKSFQESIM